MHAPQQMPATGDTPAIPFTPRPVAHIKLRATFPGATIVVAEHDKPSDALRFARRSIDSVKQWS